MGLSYFYVWSRFHALAEFDEVKRSCRKRLADHNRRRRKPQPGTTSDSPARKTPQNGIDKNQETEKTRGFACNCPSFFNFQHTVLSLMEFSVFQQHLHMPCL